MPSISTSSPPGGATATTFEATQRRYSGFPWFLIAIFAIIRLLFALRMPLIPDEAYYWDWTRFLSAGYFDHPPMVAWVAALTTGIFGDTVFGVHAGPLGLIIGAWFLTLILGRRFFRERSSGTLVLIMMNATALFGITFFMLTPDAPQAFFWAAGLLTGYHALFTRKSLDIWLLLGAVSGLGLLSKYTFALFLISFAVFLVFNRSGRSFLRKPHPYAAFLSCLIVYSPNLIWNAQNDWIAIGFQLGHGLAGKGGVRFDYLGDYLAGQVGLLGLFLFIVLIMASVRLIRRERSNPMLMYCFAFYAVPYGFFALSSLAKRVEANWPGPAHLAAFIVIGWYFEQLRADRAMKRIRFVIGSTIVAAILVGAILFHILIPVMPIPRALDMTAQARGWDALGREVSAVVSRADPFLRKPICANRYQETALLAFHMPGNPRTWPLNLGSRENHYNLLDGRKKALQDTLFFVRKLRDGLELEPYLADKFVFIASVDTIFLKQPPHANEPFGVFLGLLAPAALEDVL